MGMCFGVKDALKATEQVENPASTTILGELVHNATVQGRLQARGFLVQPERERSHLPASPQVLITAHGISDTLHNQLKEAGKSIVDTTCPLVRRVHKTVLHLQKHGYHVVVVGKPGHVEVEGLVGDLRDYSVFERPTDIRPLAAQKIAVVSQTTTPPELFAQVSQAVAALHPQAEVRIVDTVCSPTRERQTAVEDLLGKIQLLVVVGGRNSNNTRRLGEMAERRGKPFIHVEDASQLKAEHLRGYSRVGLTAGTSTPDDLIEGVHRRLLELGRLLQKQLVAVA